VTRPLLSTSDEMPSTESLLERLRSEGKQPTVKVPACIGCGGMPHRGIGVSEECIRKALFEARVASVLATTERAELLELRSKVERLERQISNSALQARGRG
jgi:hypothetical protein